MRKVVYYLKPHVWKMSWGLFIKCVGSIMDLLIPWVLSKILDDILPLEDVGLIFVWGGVMILCALIAVITNIVANRMAGRVSAKMTEALRHDLYSKITYMSCRQTDSFTIPSLISRLTSDTYNVHSMVGMMQRLGVRAPLLLVVGIIVTMTLEPVLTMVLVSILPILTVIVYFVSKSGIPMYTRIQQVIDVMVRKVQEFMTGIRVIKALSKSDYEKDRFEEINREEIKNEQKAGMVMSVTNPVMNLLLNAGLTLVIVLGAYRVNIGVTQPGKIIAFLSYFTIILQAMMAITRMFVVLSKGIASANRIETVLDAESEIEIFSIEPQANDYHVEFKDVTFSYNKVADNLSNISFALKRGETLGIIGATGSGKTTVVNALLRLYDIDKGEILIDGANIKSIPDDVLHRKFGVVFQNDFIIADKIRENIYFGRDIKSEEIYNTAKVTAQASDFINNLEDTDDYQLTIKGSNLSGGQKQRLLIARALADNPEILILDDSSSALDYKTDANLRRAIHNNFKDTTTIIIAQRISSIKNSNHIMVIDEGKCIGYGSHEYLLETCASYREISEIQMGGEDIE
jgi:ATP-binding cassette subfamily B protein